MEQTLKCRPKSLRRKYVANFHHLGFGSDFLDKAAKGQATKGTGILDFLRFRVPKTTIKQLDIVSHKDGYYKHRIQQMLVMIGKNWGPLCTNGTIC